MKFSAYLKDRIPDIIIFITVWIVSLVFLSAYRFLTEAMVILSIVLWFGAVAVFLRDFFRKKFFYDKLLNCLNELDQKYLLSEMVTQPDFLEGRILTDVLGECSRSMCGNVAAH
ncbi:MAG: sensor histidine kinase, partial [Oscillospiraceae bacterium]|nr:sensor histidine kinase [Oscillospiraceae bacterium]